MPSETSAPRPAAVWLHGFASSPASSKARFVQARLQARGLPLLIPDLNLPRFSSLTVGRMLGELDALAAHSPTQTLLLAGSSLGGYTAAVWAAQNPERCAALVLLAPAFCLARRWTSRMDPAVVAGWWATGSTLVEHYGWGTQEPLSIGFLEEAARYDDYPLPRCPTLVLQGTLDEVVTPDLAREFDRRMRAAQRPCTLLELADGHELNRNLPRLAAEVERHFGLA